MKVLAFSDFHGLFGFTDHFIEVKKKIDLHEPDLLLLCGDLQDRGSIKLLENRIKSLLYSPIFFVWGNSEEQLDITRELENAINLHLKIREIDGFHFVGLGGDEYDVKRDVGEMREMLKKTPLKGENLIIMSHVPPFNTVDSCNDGRNVGVAELRDLIEDFKPILVLCGHIHEQVQKLALIGSSRICNVGPKGVLITIEGKQVSIDMLK